MEPAAIGVLVFERGRRGGEIVRIPPVDGAAGRPRPKCRPKEDRGRRAVAGRRPMPRALLFVYFLSRRRTARFLTLIAR